jgi:hypothetical protein
MGASIVCWNPLTSSRTNVVDSLIPSITTVSPAGTVLNVRLTLSGKIVNEVVALRPVESVTVRRIS